MERILPRTNHRDSASSSLLRGAAGCALLLYGIKKRSLFGAAASLIGADLLCRGVTGHSLSSFAGLSTGGLGFAAIPHQLGIQVRRSITIGVDPEQAYKFVRGFQNIPKFMKHIANVKVLDDTRSEWTAVAGEKELCWISRVINDIPNQVIAWRSEGCASIQSAGSVWFEKAPKNQGTVVRVTLQYFPPGGAVTAGIGKLFGIDPERQIGNELRRLKQLLETGEIATTQGQPAGGERGQKDALHLRHTRLLSQAAHV